jgi:hypothetical protein
MSLDFSRMAADMYARGQAIRFKGPRFMDYCKIVSQGSIESIVGKAFVTADVGLIPGAGPSAGIGTAITGVQAATIKTMIITTANGFQFKGPRLPDIAGLFADALVQEIANATLTSTHAPVFTGAGVVNQGSYTVVQPAWASLIFTYGTAKRFKGPKWMNWCTALATGAVAGFADASGQVVIAGSFGGSAPPGPLPGAGAGAGIVT